MSTRRLLLFALALAPCLVHAQEAAGRVFNPRLSPANPDLIAYEALSGDRQVLYIQRLSNGQRSAATTLASAAPSGLVGLPGLTSSSQVSVFSGDVDWRPVSEDGKQWFAFVASDRGAVKLFVNYVESNGDVATHDPVPLPSVGSARHPRWSPDGKHLAFISDSSQLHIFWNLGLALHENGEPIVPAALVAETGSGVMFPAWSPKSNYIAYQAERRVRGSRRFQIEVIGVDTSAAWVRGAPVVLTDELTDANAFRPSWSLDARYIAYYVDRLGGSGDGSASIDIGVLEAQVQPTSGRILRGEILRGQSRRIAEAVLPNVARGPSWTRMYIGPAAKPALVYVQRDDARGNPIYAHSVDAWVGMRSRDSSRVSFSSMRTTVNHREVTATESQGFVRYAYASVASGGEVLSTFDDSTAKWAKGSPVTLAREVAVASAHLESTVHAASMDAPADRSSAVGPRTAEPMLKGANASTTAYGAANRRSNSLALAMVFPGAAQLAGGQTTKALLLGAAGVLGGSLFVYGTAAKRYAASAQLASGTAAGREAAQLDALGKRKVQLLGAGTIGLSWFIGVVDAAMHRGSTSR